MKITNERKLKELQKEFNRIYPYLNIQFYSKPHVVGESSSDADQLDNELTIGKVRDKNTVGFMNLDGRLSVGEFEKMFEMTFGLNVQVYRKARDKWLQTWATDVWTLAEQNHRGQILGSR